MFSVFNTSSTGFIGSILAAKEQAPLSVCAKVVREVSKMGAKLLLSLNSGQDSWSGGFSLNIHRLITWSGDFIIGTNLDTNDSFEP